MSSPQDARHPIHSSEWERQREQLSALIDGELSAAERAGLERHLGGCAQCQAELAQLRRVRVLLGALPAPAVPRSFTLPASGKPPARNRSGGRAPDREPATASVLYRASRWVGGIAASL